MDKGADKSSEQTQPQSSSTKPMKQATQSVPNVGNHPLPIDQQGVAIPQQGVAVIPQQGVAIPQQGQAHQAVKSIQHAPPQARRAPPGAAAQKGAVASKPTAKSGTKSGAPSSDGGSWASNNKGILAGIIVGAGLMLIIGIIAMVCVRKKKKKQRELQMQYYGNNTQGNGNYYNATGQCGTWGQPPPGLRPPPGSGMGGGMGSGGMGGMGGGGMSGGMGGDKLGGWATPPPPPPGMMSSDMSSSNFSGPYQAPLPPPHPVVALGLNKNSFSFEELAAATGGFSNEKLLGQGGFGYVHRGALQDGTQIAVKSLKSGSGQGEREFQAEVDIISRVHHRHLVSLVGYCIAGSQRMLVYEYVPNNTLEYHLHGKDRPTMEWSTRLKIALGAAKGFAYLHEDCHPRIIHRDIKAANILLDNEFEAKVADFGLAKLSSDNYTHVSTRIMGTFGYLAPEYAASGKLTEKSDVYSYGVVLLELIAGRCPVDVRSTDDDSLVDWARPILIRATEGGDYQELVDKRLLDKFNPEEMMRMVACAASCIRHSARRRPKMSQIVRILEGDVSLDSLNDPAKSGGYASHGSASDSEVSSYNVDLKKFRKVGNSSQEMSSGEQGVTSELHRPPLRR